MANDMQSVVTKLLLAQLEKYDFVLAGGGALVELELTNRPTRDIDLFTSSMGANDFAQATELAVLCLTASRYDVSTVLKTDTFARLCVSDDSDTVIVELGYDYREYPPAKLDVGSVLDKRDAILNKISALYARSLPRDFIDVYNIRKSGEMSDAEILAQSYERDEGFVLEYFIIALRKIETLQFEDFAEYEISREQFCGIKESTLDWASNIDSSL
jgi:hypothetical protein